MGEKASLFPAGDARLIQHQAELADRLGAYGTSDPRLVQHMGELQDRIAAAVTYGSIRTSDGLDLRTARERRADRPDAS